MDRKFSMMVFAPLAPTPERGYKPRIYKTSGADFGDTMSTLGPSLFVPLPERLCRASGVTVKIERMDDFEPASMLERNDYLKELAGARDYLRGPGASETIETVVSKLRSDFPSLPFEIKKPVQAKPSRGRSAVDDLLSMVSLPGQDEGPGPGSSEGPAEWLSRLEEAITLVLRHILSDPSFRMYEAAWRGLGLLLAGAGEELEVRVTSVTPAAWSEAIDRLTDTLYEDPPDFLLVDFPLDGGPLGLEIMSSAAALADNLMAPAAVWVSEKFLGLDQWSRLNRLPYLRHHLDGAPFSKYRNLRGKPGADWLCVMTNRAPARPLHQELGIDEKTPLYLSPVWVLAKLMAARFADSGWPTMFTGSGLNALPAIEVDGERMAVEGLFPAERVPQFVEIGISPLFKAPADEMATLPRAVTAAGKELDHQLVLSRLLNLVLNLKAEAGAEDPEAAGELVRKAVGGLWTDAGLDPPADLAITMEETGGPWILTVSLTPSGVASADGRIEFSLNW